MTFSPEDFELLEISLLRKMLNQHFRSLEKSMNEKATRVNEMNEGITETTKKLRVPKFELERVIDDFVFMCFFIGNDFLPCIPHMDISDGSLNLMMNVYRDMLPDLGGYLTDKAKIHLPRVELFMQEIGRREPLYFQQRATDEKDFQYADDGYKDHYYKTKLAIEPTDHTAKSALITSYIEGLAWVLTYYHNGCGSWTWYYPYLYAPLATDLKNLALINLEFNQGTPFTPLLQLLSVLPPQSGNFLPPSYAALMTSSESPLLDYYPKDFEVDANGKKNSWECIVKIPFIDETTLVDAVCTIDHNSVLDESEKARNIRGQQHVFEPKNPNASMWRKVDSEFVGKKFGNALLDERMQGVNKYVKQQGDRFGTNDRPISDTQKSWSKKPIGKRRQDS